MYAKFLKILILLFPLQSFGEQQFDAFENGMIGTCFEDSSAFLKRILGVNSLTDVNISVTSKNRWIWIVDHTSDKNYAWYVLEKNRNSVCWQVFVPAAATVQFETEKSESKFIALISPEIDYPVKIIEFRKKPTAQYYFASKCYVLNVVDSKNSKKEISCKTIYD